MDVEKLKHDASLVQWSDMQDLPSVDDKVAFLCSHILRVFDKHAPVRPVKLKHRPTPWITDPIRKAMAYRDRLFRRYKKHRSDENWSAWIWKFLRSLGVGKPPNQEGQIPLDLNDLNRYFTSAPSLDPLTKMASLNLIKSTITPTPDIESFNFSPASRDEIKKIILSLKSKAVGHDSIGRVTITSLLDILLPAITHIVNHSLSSGQFPNLWLKAYVLPLPKVPTPSAPNEYRPISILPFLSKILESIVHRQLTSFLTNGGLLNPLQSGFRSGHSTTTALLKVTEDVRCAMEDRRVTILVLIDFSNAFNAVDHDLLLAVLECHKISAPAISWFSSYLRGRQQAIRSGPSVQSVWADLTAGVPQGGILSPLLFSTFINSVTSNLHCSYHLYADDLQIYSHVKIDELDAGIAGVNGDLDEILRWSQNYGISVNPKKCQSIIIGSSRLLSCLDYNTVPPVQFDGRVVPFSPAVTDLGLTIDEYLSWEQQLEKVSRKVYASLHSMLRLKNFLPQHTKLALVNSLLLPILDYADVCYLDLTETLLNKLERLLNTCACTITSIDQEVAVSSSSSAIQAAVTDTGLTPIALISDQGSSFQSAINSLLDDTKRDQLCAGEIVDETIHLNGASLSVFFDPPHLLKGIRNNLLTKDMLFEGKRVTWNDIVDVYNADCKHGESRILHKLTDQHVIPEKNEALYPDGKPVSKTMKNTAAAVSFIDDLFDSVNGASTNEKKIEGKISAQGCYSKISSSVLG
ncbi:unnamed protein product [Plutella xylostella]|uniref:(diamondback moth) hypothetical protein n=1 Tax=Plutella xylostella TaxID=51655 RepID=A0A8S4F8Q2_PLUXY|nr:unnamed protein product [Plutella xylostella]